MASVIPDGLDTELLGSLLSHLLGTRYEKLRGQLKSARPDVNHDLQNALTGAFWSSLLFVAADYGDRVGRPMSAPEKWNAPGWLSGAWQLARRAGSASRKARTPDPLLDALYPALQERIRTAAAVQGGMDKAYKQFQKLLKREPETTDWLEALRLAALEHLRGLAPAETRIPEEMEADLRERFFALFRGAFAAAIKTRTEVERIANATLLAEIHEGVTDLKHGQTELKQGMRTVIEILTPRKPRSQARPANVEKYREEIAKEAGFIDLGALKIKADLVRVPIDDLWVPATTLLGPKDDGKGKGRSQLGQVEQEPRRLEEALGRHRLLAIQGEAGTGKSTFVKRIAFELVRPHPAAEPLDLPFRGMPLWVTVKELETYIVKNPRGGEWPTQDKDPAWLAHCLSDSAAAKRAGLDHLWFDEQLCDPNAILLLDGLDEASADWRGRLAALVLKAETQYGCRIAVTMRPETEQSERLLGATPRFTILPMENGAVNRFIDLWTRNAGGDAKAKEHGARLRRNLDAKPAIRRMARNPLMLTVLAVLTSNGQELPEERAALLKAIVEWLAKSKLNDEQARVDQIMVVLGELALGMIRQTGENKYAVGCDTAAGLVARYLNEAKPDIPAAKRLLEEAELRTALVADRGGKLVFWHRYFQEYLAAARMADVDEYRDLAWELMDGRQSPEVLRLLAGCLAPRGVERLDSLMLHLIRQIRGQDKLEARAYGVGILAGMCEDVRPTKYLERARFGQKVKPAYDDLLASIVRVFDPREAETVSIPDRVAAAEALAKSGGDTRLRLPKPGLDRHAEEYWVRVRGGTFLMGAQAKDRNKPGYDSESFGDEGPPRMETVSDFLMGRYPVTVFEYERFLEDIEREPEPAWVEKTNWKAQVEHPSRPVVRLTWDEAREYCEWAGGFLPSERHWEYAARGPGDEPRRYPWGNDEPTPGHANWNESRVGAPSPVGLFPLGDALWGEHRISDLAGNVWEWTSSKYDSSRYVLRGGSFDYDYARYLRAACRFSYAPGDRDDDIGFRCAREVSS